VNRRFREAEYTITIHPNGNQKGVKQVILDGQPIEGNTIPYSAGKHTVEVTM
jgi:cellobiose phosphorylase